VLLDHPGSTVAELAEVLDRDRSNVNRSLTTLMEKGLANRQRRLLDPGGYVYQYTATPLPEAKEMLHDALDTWAETVHERIDDFGSGSAA
jgi:predicted transcriptional regulator